MLGQLRKVNFPPHFSHFRFKFQQNLSFDHCMNILDTFSRDEVNIKQLNFFYSYKTQLNFSALRENKQKEIVCIQKIQIAQLTYSQRHHQLSRAIIHEIWFGLNEGHSADSCLGFGKLFNVLQSPIGRVASQPMRNIETFPSKHMYLYLSLVERKVADFYHNMPYHSMPTRTLLLLKVGLSSLKDKRQ